MILFLLFIFAEDVRLLGVSGAVHSERKKKVATEGRKQKRWQWREEGLSGGCAKGLKRPACMVRNERRQNERCFHGASFLSACYHEPGAC